MAYAPQQHFEDGEEAVGQLEVSFDRKGKQRLRLTMTTRALYWEGREHVRSPDPHFTERAPIEAIESIRLTRSSRVFAVVVGLFGCGAGAALAYATYMTEPVIEKAFGLGVALMFGGPLFALLGGRQKQLVVRSADATLTFEQPVAFGAPPRHFAAGMEALELWARTHQVPFRAR